MLSLICAIALAKKPDGEEPLPTMEQAVGPQVARVLQDPDLILISTQSPATLKGKSMSQDWIDKFRLKLITRNFINWNIVARCPFHPDIFLHLEQKDKFGKTTKVDMDFCFTCQMIRINLSGETLGTLHSFRDSSRQTLIALFHQALPNTAFAFEDEDRTQGR